MNRWADEIWSSVPLHCSVTRIGKVTDLEILIPINGPGSFRVHIDAEGFLAVKEYNQARTDKVWKGLVAFNPSSVWWVESGDSTSVSNLQVLHTPLTASHDVALNGCNFSDQLVECGWQASFDVESTDATSFVVLHYPRIYTDQHYNFIVSYGGYVDYECELGDLSVTVDQFRGPGTTGIRQTRALPEPPKGKLGDKTSASEQHGDTVPTPVSLGDQLATGKMTTATELVEKAEAEGRPSACTQSSSVMETPEQVVGALRRTSSSPSISQLISHWQRRSMERRH